MTLLLFVSIVKSSHIVIIIVLTYVRRIIVIIKEKIKDKPLLTVHFKKCRYFAAISTWSGFSWRCPQ